MLVIRHRRCRDVVLLRVDTPTLDGWDLSGAYLPGATLSAESCQGTRFEGANLREADLRRTSLRQARLAGAVLRGADLRGADLREACLDGADLTDVLYDDRTQWPPGRGPLPPPLSRKVDTPLEKLLSWLAASKGWRERL